MTLAVIAEDTNVVNLRVRVHLQDDVLTAHMHARIGVCEFTMWADDPDAAYDHQPMIRCSAFPAATHDGTEGGAGICAGWTRCATIAT